MTTANYITINSKKYVVIIEGNERQAVPPKTVSDGVNGNTIVSMGPGSNNEMMQFVLFIDYTPATGYGSVADIMSAANEPSVSYTDHVTGESSVWGSGTFDITILTARKLMLPGATMPSTGSLVAIEAQKVLV